MADVLRHAYDDALCVKDGGIADGVLICGGTLRGDSVYGPGTYATYQISITAEVYA